jgi:hypothetical protein
MEVLQWTPPLPLCGNLTSICSLSSLPFILKDDEGGKIDALEQILFNFYFEITLDS